MKTPTMPAATGTQDEKVTPFPYYLDLCRIWWWVWKPP